MYVYNKNIVIYMYIKLKRVDQSFQCSNMITFSIHQFNPSKSQMHHMLTRDTSNILCAQCEYLRCTYARLYHVQVIIN